MSLLAEVTGVSADRIAQLRQQEPALREDRFVGIFARMRQVADLAADDRSRRHLLSLCDKAEARSSDSSGEPARINLRFEGRTFEISFPDDPHSVFTMAEIFVGHEYRLTRPAPRIYDFGGNIGLSALYFAALYPEAEIIAIEPVEANLRHLRENFAANRINGRVIAAAAGNERGTLRMYLHHTGSMNSALFRSFRDREAPAVDVECVPFSEIVTGSGYGLKIDIEGGEHAIVDEEWMIANAAWVTGELHFGVGLDLARAPLFREMLDRHFAVDWSHPRVVGDSDQWTCAFSTTSRVDQIAGIPPR